MANGRRRVQRGAAAKRASGPTPPPPPPPPATEGDHSEFSLSNVEIERALRTGEHAGLLEDYFGTEQYAELRDLARDASTRAVRGGDKVLILPGIMGSKIGRKGAIGLFDDVFWLDPVDVARGRLSELALEEPGSRYDALGAMLIAYLKLKLRLDIAGFDAEFHDYDWRRGLPTLGRELTEALRRRGGETVAVVAHSMGGLVARWALGNGATCRRLVMLGTPNFGSFAPVLALRGTYDVVRKVAAIDQRHTAEELARDVFSTFPGLTQMLPSPEQFDGLDLYDLANWPDDGLRPRREILDGVQAVQKQLAKGSDRFVLIAGVDQRTVTGIRRAGAEFEYEYSQAGDGTVPLDFARLDGVPTYYVAETHGSLPNNKAVARAVIDLLRGDTTNALPSTYAFEDRRGPAEWKAESALRVDPYAGRRGGRLSQRELRSVLEEVVAPTARDDLAPPLVAARVSLATDGAEPGFGHRFDGVIVGRRKQHRVDLTFARGSITEANTRAIALGIFRDVAPSGAARALDERLGGAITEMSRRRMFSGNVGEIFILPTGRHQLMADYVAFVGLGPFDRFNDEVLQTAAENLVRTFVSARIEEFATVLFGGGSGERPASALRNLLGGFIRGLSDADTKQQFRHIQICEQDPARFTDIKAEVYRLSSTSLCTDIEFTFDEEVLQAPPESTPMVRRAEQHEDPAYLIVRQERLASDGGDFDVRSSVLTAGAKAAVVTGVRSVSGREFEALRRRITTPGADFATEGPKLARLLLADELLAVLPRERERHLVIVHDAPSSRTPWETIAFPMAGGDPWVPALEAGISHKYSAENLAVAKWLEERIQDETLNVLLVANPTLDLDGAADEARRITEVFGSLPGSRFEVLSGTQATRPALLAAFGSGRYDVIHYAGHAFFDERHPERSGLLCHGAVPLTGADIAGLGRLPSLVFFNACESSRVRGVLRDTLSRPEQLDRHVGVAEALMRGGVANFLGTYWPVGDAPATAFAVEFYRALIGGKPLGAAVLDGRRKVREQGSSDWADYVLYGNPAFVLKEAATPGAASSGAASSGAAASGPAADTGAAVTTAERPSGPAPKAAAKKAAAKQGTKQGTKRGATKRGRRVR